MKKLFEILKQAGQIALDEQKSLKIQKKPDTSIVTNGDLAVSQFLEQELLKLYPDYSIYSEENYSTPTTKKVIVIDPIDGTESYARKEDTWTILIGFIDDGIMTQGVIYQPTQDLLYYGSLGQGSFVIKNGIESRLDANRTGKFKGMSSHKMYGEDVFFKNNQIKDISHMYSAALKIMKVAEGEIDAYPNFRKKCSLWDLVAPMVILNEAGGTTVFEKEFKIDYVTPAVPLKFFSVGKRGLNFKF